MFNYNFFNNLGPDLEIGGWNKGRQGTEAFTNATHLAHLEMPLALGTSLYNGRNRMMAVPVK